MNPPRQYVGRFMGRSSVVMWREIWSDESSFCCLLCWSKARKKRHTHTHTHWQNEYKRRKEGNQLSFHEWNEPDRWVLLVMLHPTTVVVSLTFTWAFSCLLPDLSNSIIVKSHHGFLFSHDGRSSFYFLLYLFPKFLCLSISKDTIYQWTLLIITSIRIVVAVEVDEYIYVRICIWIW